MTPEQLPGWSSSWCLYWPEEADPTPDPTAVLTGDYPTDAEKRDPA